MIRLPLVGQIVADLDEHGVADLARAAVHASFASDATKSALFAEIGDYLSDER